MIQTSWKKKNKKCDDENRMMGRNWERKQMKNAKQQREATCECEEGKGNRAQESLGCLEIRSLIFTVGRIGRQKRGMEKQKRTVQ